LSSKTAQVTGLFKSRVRANKFAATYGEADRRRLNSSDEGRFRDGLKRFQPPCQVTFEKPWRKLHLIIGVRADFQMRRTRT
jgi:hypothetical protein